MIAVDTSALVAVVLGEEDAGACIDILEAEADILLSATTLAETLIVAAGRNVGGRMRELIDAVAPTVVPVTGETSSRIAEIYARWGKGSHPARLNILDCFAYEVATANDCPLLFVGEDFAQTDVRHAIER